MQVDHRPEQKRGGGGHTEPDTVGEGEAAPPKVLIRELGREATRDARRLHKRFVVFRVEMRSLEWFNLAQLACVAVAQPGIPNHARAAALDFVVDIANLLGQASPALADALLQAVPVPDDQGEDWERLRRAYVDSMRHVNGRSNGRAH